jgi:mono/diheme cytochrome c family protein
MQRILKRIGLILGTVLVVLIVVSGSLILIGGSRLNKQYDIQPDAVTISTDTAVIERGQYIYSVNCAGCHGDDHSGSAFIDDEALGKIPAPNLTAGQGGIGTVYHDSDYVRALRHGVDNEGKPLAVMPAQAFWYFSDEDLGAIIAYIKSVPPVDMDRGEKNISPLGRIFITVGALNILSTESIDHTGPRPQDAPERGITAVYGEYLVNTGDCRLCHGDALSGAHPPEPGAPFGPNLTPGGALGDWSEADFVETMRTGITPDNRKLDITFMPWEDIGRMTDDDLTAVYLYLHSLPTLETTE